jgi:hypothetical protein
VLVLLPGRLLFREKNSKACTYQYSFVYWVQDVLVGSDLMPVRH